MNTATQQKMELLLSDLRSRAKLQFKRAIGALAFSEKESRPFVSSSAITTAMGGMRQNCKALLERAITEVLAVCNSAGAISLVRAAIVEHLSDLVQVVEQWPYCRLNNEQLALVRENYSVYREDLLLIVDSYQGRFKNQGGRPVEWPWDQVRAHVMSQNPKGFKPYRGLQSEIAQVMTQWFEERFGGDAPGRTRTLQVAGQLIKEHQR